MQDTGYLQGCRYLLHDRDQKFCREFRETLAAGGVKCLPLPPRLLWRREVREARSVVESGSVAYSNITAALHGIFTIRGPPQDFAKPPESSHICLKLQIATCRKY